jgi:hypothetical protein
MAKTLNQIGSLSELQKLLSSVREFKSLDEITYFFKNYKNTCSKIEESIELEFVDKLEALRKELLELRATYDNQITEQREKLNQEKISNINELNELENTRPLGFFKRIYNKFCIYVINLRQEDLDNNFESEVQKPFIQDKLYIDGLENRINHLVTNRQSVIDAEKNKKLNRINNFYSIIRDNFAWYLGALGEQSATKELAKLPEGYYLINDVKLSFNPPIYNKKNDDAIYSIQIDHVVIGPTGLYLIETKNWSKESMNNADLFSPIKQILRNNFATFVYLNQLVSNGDLSSFCQAWGPQRISPLNIVLMINSKPSNKYQYVEILSLDEINRHIISSDKIFTDDNISELVSVMTRNR